MYNLEASTNIYTTPLQIISCATERGSLIVIGISKSYVMFHSISISFYFFSVISYGIFSYEKNNRKKVLFWKAPIGFWITFAIGFSPY